MTPLVVVLAIVVQVPAWISPPSPFTPSSSNLAAEEDITTSTTGAEAEEFSWMVLVPRTQGMKARATAEEEEDFWDILGRPRPTRDHFQSVRRTAVHDMCMLYTYFR